MTQAFITKLQNIITNAHNYKFLYFLLSSSQCVQNFGGETKVKD